MQKVLFFLLSIILFSIHPNNTDDRFVGKWEGVDGGDIGYIVFEKEGYAYFEIQGQIYGGKEFELDGQKGSMTYSINDKVIPIQVDLVVTNHDTNEKKTLWCIAEFISESEMNFALGFEEVRPISFDTEDAIFLRKIE